MALYNWTRSDGSSMGHRSWPQPFAGSSVWLPSGHWQAAKIPFGVNHQGDQGNSELCRIYPRPDSEVNSWAAHKNHFYDGVHSVPQTYPLGCRGGAFPHVYVCLAAPAAANVSVGATYEPTGKTFATFTVTPTGSYTNATFWFRAYDMSGDFLDYIFTASTYGAYNANNETGFLFVGANPYGASPSDSNTGSITAPFATLTPIYGTTFGGTSNPGAQVYFAGTVDGLALSASYGIQLEGGVNPCTLRGYPGQSATLDISNGGTICCVTFGSNAHDVFIGDFTLIGSVTSGTTYAQFYNTVRQDRFTEFNISAPDVYNDPETTANDNQGLNYNGDPNTTTYSEYYFLRNVSETNRTGTYGEALFSWYRHRYCLVDFCSATGVGTNGPPVKISNLDTTVRSTKIVLTSGGSWALNHPDYVASTNPLPNGNHEVCYNVLDASVPGQFCMGFNQSYGTVGNCWSYRNSYLGRITVNAPAGNGPFSFENDAIQWINQAVEINQTTGSLPANVTNVNTEAQAASGVFVNPAAGDYSLSNSTLTGTHGAYIS